MDVLSRQQERQNFTLKNPACKNPLLPLSWSFSWGWSVRPRKGEGGQNGRFSADVLRGRTLINYAINGWGSVTMNFQQNKCLQLFLTHPWTKRSEGLLNLVKNSRRLWLHGRTTKIRNGKNRFGKTTREQFCRVSVAVDTWPARNRTITASRKFTELKFHFIIRENTYKKISTAEKLLTLPPKRLNNNVKKASDLTIGGGGIAPWPPWIRHWSKTIYYRSCLKTLQ